MKVPQGGRNRSETLHYFSWELSSRSISYSKAVLENDIEQAYQNWYAFTPSFGRCEVKTENVLQHFYMVIKSLDNWMQILYDKEISLSVEKLVELNFSPRARISGSRVLSCY
jgi:hypothetical protein